MTYDVFIGYQQIRGCYPSTDPVTMALLFHNTACKHKAAYIQIPQRCASSKSTLRSPVLLCMTSGPSGHKCSLIFPIIFFLYKQSKYIEDIRIIYRSYQRPSRN
uniref:Uncharacterized protein n=1 Tax=Opuntia streptacantha TaxID=393608 RepID=A0A7C9EN78_OPUST